MAVLVASAELAVFRRTESLSGFIPASWRVSARSAAKAAGASVLVVGDSQVKCGLLPPVIESRLGLKAINLAVVGGQPASSYYLFSRTLRAGAAPKAVIVDAFPGLLAADLRINVRQWPELLGPVEVIDLLATSSDRWLAAPALLRVALPSLLRRDEIRKTVRSGLDATGVDASRAEALAYRRNWRVNGGAHALAPKPDFRDEPAAAVGPVPSVPRWKVKPENAVYVRRLLRLAADHGIPVFWLLPTNSPGYRADREGQGIDPAYRAYVRRLQDEFPAVTVLDPGPLLDDASRFRDACHLDHRGASLLSASVADVLAEWLMKPGSGERWIALSPPESVPNVAIEDLDRSRAALGLPSASLAAKSTDPALR
jgi:hypothetical protein